MALAPAEALACRVAAYCLRRTEPPLGCSRAEVDVALGGAVYLKAVSAVCWVIAFVSTVLVDALLAGAVFACLVLVRTALRY